MKKIITITTLFLFVVAFSAHAQKKMFLRVYDRSGSKKYKGYLTGTTDSSFVLQRNSLTCEINYRDVFFIKTQRSIGHSILVTASTMGLATGILFLIANSHSAPASGGTGALNFNFSILAFSDAEVVAAGTLLGITGGAAIGAISGSLKKRNTYLVNGNLSDWLNVKPIFDQIISFSEKNEVTKK